MAAHAVTIGLEVVVTERTTMESEIRTVLDGALGCILVAHGADVVIDPRNAMFEANGCSPMLSAQRNPRRNATLGHNSHKAVGDNARHCRFGNSITLDTVSIIVEQTCARLAVDVNMIMAQVIGRRRLVVNSGVQWAAVLFTLGVHTPRVLQWLKTCSAVCLDVVGAQVVGCLDATSMHLAVEQGTGVLFALGIFAPPLGHGV